MSDEVKWLLEEIDTLREKYTVMKKDRNTLYGEAAHFKSMWETAEDANIQVTEKLATAKRIARERQGDIIELTIRLDEALVRVQELEDVLNLDRNRAMQERDRYRKALEEIGCTSNAPHAHRIATEALEVKDDYR